MDDKAGVMVHLAAIGAWIGGRGPRCPSTSSFVVEGEEEIGSEHLDAVPAARYRERLQADAIVLTDTSNLEARPAVAHDAPARPREGARSR